MIRFLGTSLTIVGLLSAVPCGAAVLNLDFGLTSVGTATTTDPYHATIGDVANLTWNSSLGTGDKAVGTLLYGDGTAAAGVALNMGVTNVAQTDSLLATQPSDNSNLGTWINTGIYASPSAARDAIFDKNGGSNNRGTTVQISGLAAGDYDIYYVGRNTSANNGDVSGSYTYTQTLHAGTSASSGDFTFTSYASDVINYNIANTQTTNWIDGGTYAKLTVTLASGEYLNLAFTGGGHDLRGFANALQIVSVPEPASMVLLGAGILTMLPRRRNARVAAD